jgi:hypothetical protein
LPLCHTCFLNHSLSSSPSTVGSNTNCTVDMNRACGKATREDRRGEDLFHVNPPWQAQEGRAPLPTKRWASPYSACNISASPCHQQECKRQQAAKSAWES